ncbi:hypothetical protein OUZ56_027222 [Daphnia magna]|uniref:Uncharacterized protein n=1 Tax=Daphnia magna TaxID=35525 RepID=A0ABQ9ZP58_9CRUS|nr:hypothetical protein OUZ56_027222 [Daphnia magna]
MAMNAAEKEKEKRRGEKNRVWPRCGPAPPTPLQQKANGAVCALPSRFRASVKEARRCDIEGVKDQQQPTSFGFWGGGFEKKVFLN